MTSSSRELTCYALAGPVSGRPRSLLVGHRPQLRLQKPLVETRLLQGREYVLRALALHMARVDPSARLINLSAFSRLIADHRSPYIGGMLQRHNIKRRTDCLPSQIRPVTALLPVMAVVSIAFLIIGFALPVLPLHVHHGL